jgi:hypothetical protein
MKSQRGDSTTFQIGLTLKEGDDLVEATTNLVVELLLGSGRVAASNGGGEAARGRESAGDGASDGHGTRSHLGRGAEGRDEHVGEHCWLGVLGRI